MPRPPYFGEKTPRVVSLLKEILELHKVSDISISLTYMAKRVHSVIAGIPPYKVRWRINKRTGKKEKVPDPLRHILFKLLRKAAKQKKDDENYIKWPVK